MTERAIQPEINLQDKQKRLREIILYRAVFTLAWFVIFTGIIFGYFFTPVVEYLSDSINNGKIFFFVTFPPPVLVQAALYMTVSKFIYPKQQWKNMVWSLMMIVFVSVGLMILIEIYLLYNWHPS